MVTAPVSRGRPSVAVTPERMTLAEFLNAARGEAGAGAAPRGCESESAAFRSAWFSLQVWFSYPDGHVCRAARGWPGPFLRSAWCSVRTHMCRTLRYMSGIEFLKDEHGDVSVRFTTPPDLIVEVLSPVRRLAISMDKCREYLGHGVLVALMVDPGRRNVLVLRPDSQSRPLRQGVMPSTSPTSCRLFEMTVSALFSRIRARPLTATQLSWIETGDDGHRI